MFNMCSFVLDLIKSHGSNEPRNIASKLNIKVFYRNMPVGVSGVLINPEIKKAIIINSRLSRKQQRVALAHELGHVLLHSKYYNLFDELDCDLRKQLDTDADAFAHMLLTKRGNHETKTCN